VLRTRGDFQVSNFAAEVEARTIGARVMDTALMPGRNWSLEPFYGLTPFARDASGNVLPWDGSALVYWDSGNLPSPNANIPPSTQGGDPHGDPRGHAEGSRSEGDLLPHRPDRRRDERRPVLLVQARFGVPDPARAESVHVRLVPVSLSACGR